MAYIDNFPPRTGRIIKEDNTIVNEANGINADGSQNVQLTGNAMELFGATVATRPAANTVSIGATFLAIDTQRVWQSDGTNWREI